MFINNLHSEGKNIYVFWRDNELKLKATKYTNFFPYFYNENPSGVFKSYNGKSLQKVIVSKPQDIKRLRTATSWEADISLCKRFMIDKVDTIDQSPISYAFIDIEVQCTELPNVQLAEYPISCISVYNSLSKTIQTFFLPDYESEHKMMLAFIDYMNKSRPDLWLSWNVKFDYDYMYNRFPDLAEKLSVIGQSRYGHDEVRYPAGMSIVDYLMWFQKITLNREKQYTLDYIAQKYLKVAPKKKIDFNILNEDLKQHNIEDIKLLVGLEEQMNLVKYYDELRRITLVEWEDFEYNSRAIDMLLLKEAKRRNVVLPCRPTGEGEEIEFEGAYRQIYETGRLEDIGKGDIGCYSEDTDILTTEGFKSYNELKLGDMVASFNTTINKIEFQPILYLNIKQVQNLQMINLRNTFSTDQLLTLNHKVLFKKSEECHLNSNNTTDDWQICYAKNFQISHTLLPLTAEMKDREVYPISDDLLKIHAWIITEGWNAKTKDKNKIKRTCKNNKLDKRQMRTKHNLYHISQSESVNSSFCQEIDASFKNLNWNVSKHSRVRKNNRIEIDWNLKKEWSSYINLEDNYKIIPFWMLKNLSIRQLNILYSILMKGDGDKARYCYNAIDKVARDRFQYLCALIGRASYQNNRKEVYCKPNRFTSLESANFRTQHRIINYSGIIWCPTVANGFVLVRRKGKIFISGNSAYPKSIIEFGLDPANIIPIRGELHSDALCIKGTYFKQNSNALLPTIIKKLLAKKDEIKKELSECPENNPNHDNIEVTYSAIKSLVNTSYGVFGLKFFRLFDVRVAAATTFIVRSLLHYVQDKLIAAGHPVVYLDTDGIFYKNPTEEINKKLNEWVQQWGKETFKKDKVDIEFGYEGQFESILLLALCRYRGRLRKTNGELKIETKGIESKRKDSTTYLANFQDILIDKILDNEPKDKILEWIKIEISNFNKQNILDISFPCKIAKQPEEYKNIPIFIRAKTNTPEFQPKVGEGFYYIKMLGVDKDKKDNVKAFNEENFSHINREDVDWQAMLERNIINKLDVIFSAMKWSITDVYIAPPTSKICEKCLKDKSLCRFPETGNTCKTCVKEVNKPPKKPRKKKTDEV